MRSIAFVLTSQKILRGGWMAREQSRERCLPTQGGFETRLIPGHPGPDGRQIGTKQDARDALAYLQDLSAAVQKAADEHKCLAQATREIKLPKYEKWANYDAYLPMNIERFCDFHSLGI
jgi:hypothetical protein